MEAFEQFVALAMESEGLVVSGALKFPVTRQTRKAAYAEFQTHGFEVDLVGARRDRLVLATVKSFFGSRGVVAEHVRGEISDGKADALYALLNDLVIRSAVVAGAAKRFGFTLDQVEVRFYVGKFAGKASEVVAIVREVALSKQYRDNPVLATLKVLDATGSLTAPITKPARPGALVCGQHREPLTGQSTMHVSVYGRASS
jgi:hypothetical protein